MASHVLDPNMGPIPDVPQSVTIPIFVSAPANLTRAVEETVQESTEANFKEDVEEDVEEIVRVTTPSTEKTPISLADIPMELQVIIMRHLDVVSQVCLGMTGSHFYEVTSIVWNIYENWDYRPIPITLDMIGDTDTKEMMFEDCEIPADKKDVYHVLEWDISDYRYFTILLKTYPDLLDLLAKERVFDGLKFCNNCLRFKPPVAFETFDLEVKEINTPGFQIFSTSPHWFWDHERYTASCRRCRAAKLLVFWLGKTIVVADEDHRRGDFNHAKFGHWNFGAWSRDYYRDDRRLVTLGLQDEKLYTPPTSCGENTSEGLLRDYCRKWDTWEDIFEQLGI